MTSRKGKLNNRLPDVCLVLRPVPAYCISRDFTEKASKGNHQIFHDERLLYAALPE
jgi:hypothetical protein